MNINELKSTLKDGDIKNVYLFYGEEDYLIRLYISQIKDKIITNPSLEDLNFTVFDDFRQNDFEETVNTPPVFSDRKLVVFDETKILKEPTKDQKEFLEEAISDIPDYVTVIFREQSIDNRQKKLLKSIENAGAIVEFKYMTEAQLISWINIMTNHLGKKISVSNMEYLLGCVGYSMSVIENEVKKLCSFAKSDIITRKDIDGIVTKSLENRIFQLTDSIIDKNSAKALKIAYELKALKEEPIRTTALVAKNLCDMYKVKSASPQNCTPQKLGIHPYALKLHKNAKISKKGLIKLIDYLSEADEKMKSSPLDSWLLLERFIIKAMTV